MVSGDLLLLKKDGFLAVVAIAIMAVVWNPTCRLVNLMSRGAVPNYAPGVPRYVTLTCHDRPQVRRNTPNRRKLAGRFEDTTCKNRCESAANRPFALIRILLNDLSEWIAKNLYFSSLAQTTNFHSDSVQTVRAFTDLVVPTRTIITYTTLPLPLTSPKSQSPPPSSPHSRPQSSPHPQQPPYS